MDVTLSQAGGLRVAVEGCGHGELDAIYESVRVAAQKRGWDGVDLLIIGGDFQATRNLYDLNVMACPKKYRSMCDFHEYYRGARKAPYLTIFVGGNHEASSHMWELYYGGWVAPDIYYMGAANVVRIGPLRIAGMSGIWKKFDYNKHHHERLPYSNDDIRSIYHTRKVDVKKLTHLRTQVDVCMSHDWPQGIEHHGDLRALFARKPFFEKDSSEGKLGSMAAKWVMDWLRPSYWFSAHLHVKFGVTREYEESRAPSAIPDQEEDKNEGEDGDEDEDILSKLPSSFAKPAPVSSLAGRPITLADRPRPPGIQNRTVKFLALDKCVRNHQFLQLLEIAPCKNALPSNHASTPETNQPDNENRPKYKLEYDPEWLAITRAFEEDLVLGQDGYFEWNWSPESETENESKIKREEAWIDEHVVKPGKLVIPENFEITAPVYDPNLQTDDGPLEYNNPQTAAFCELIGIENKFYATDEERNERMERGSQNSGVGNNGYTGAALPHWNHPPNPNAGAPGTNNPNPNAAMGAWNHPPNYHVGGGNRGGGYGNYNAGRGNRGGGYQHRGRGDGNRGRRGNGGRGGYGGGRGQARGGFGFPG